MAIISVTLPQTISYSQEQMRVVLQSDLVNVTPAKINIQFDNTTGPSASQNLFLVWGGDKLVNFIVGGTHSISTSSSPYTYFESLPTPSGAIDEAYVKSFVNALNASDRVSTDYLISYALTSGKWVITMSYNFLTLNQPRPDSSLANVTVTYTDFTGVSSQPNLSAILRVEDVAGNILLKLNPNYNVYNNQGVVSTDIRSAFELYPHLPAYSDMQGVASKVFTAYKLRYADIYGTIPNADPLQSSSVQTVVLGGRNPISLNTFTPYSAGFYLLHSGTTKKITYDQKAWTYVIITHDTDTLNRQVNLRFSDGSTTNINFNGSPFTLSSNKVYYFASDYASLEIQTNIAAIPGLSNKKLVGWDFNLVSQTSNVIYVSQSFDLDTCYYDPIYLAYFNGLGGIDTIQMRGGYTTAKEVERNVAQRFFRNESDYTSGEFITLENQGQGVYVLETGIIGTDQAKELTQLLIGDTWLIDNSNARFIRLICDSKNILFKPRKKGLLSIQFTFKEAFKSKNFA